MEGGQHRSFDPRFYTAFYTDLRHLDAEGAVSHWLKSGRAEGRFPNDEAAEAALRADPRLPVDFDVDRYLALNPDVAEATGTHAAAINHYLRHGCAEGRTIAAPGDRLLRDPVTSRALLDPRQRTNWRAAIASRIRPQAGTHRPAPGQNGHMGRATVLDRARSAIAEATGPAAQNLPAAITEHPRCAWLFTGFSLLTYLQKTPILLSEPLSDWEIVFHALEFGLEDNRFGWPETVDAGFVRDHHGVEIDPGRPAVAAFTELRRRKKLGVTEPLCVIPSDLWAEARLPGHHLDRAFDHEYYLGLLRQNGHAAPSPSRGACIAHFVETGRHLGLPLGHGQDFDAGFYRSAYADDLRAEGGVHAFHRSDRDLYQHWISQGLTRGFAPNLAAWCWSHYGLRAPAQLLDQLGHYRLHCPDLPNHRADHLTLRHLIEVADTAVGLLDLTGAETRDFLMDVADRLVTQNQVQTAEALCWTLLRAHGMTGRPLRMLARLYDRQGKHALALNLLETVSQTDALADAETCLLLAAAHEHTGNLARAAEVVVEGARRFPGDVFLRGRRREITRKNFDRVWSHIADAAETLGLDGARADLRRAVDLCITGGETVGRAAPVRHVALVGNHDLPQCTLYRIDQKREHLEKAGYKVTVFDAGAAETPFLDTLDQFEAVIFFRVAAFPHVIEMIEKARMAGLLTFYEIDDLVFDEAIFPPPFAAYEGQIDQRHYNAMACGVPLFDMAMRLCDYGIASTPSLVEHMAPRVRTGRVFVHRNALGHTHHLAMRDATDRQASGADAGPLRIFYGSGTRAHKADFHALLEPALAATLKRIGRKVEVVLVGHFASLPLLEPYRKHVRVMEPIWDFEDYCDLLSTVDINLSVLERSAITDAKSEIKWLEAAMFAIPSIVSRTTTHEEVIVDGETGLLCDDAAGFTDRIGQLVQDADLRHRLGEAARAEALGTYSVEAQARNLTGIFDQLRPPQTAPPRKIMIVNVFYPPQTIGGATRVVHDNVRDLVRDFGDRFEIDVVCALEGSTTPYEVDVYARDGARVWSIGTPDEPDIDQKTRDPRMGAEFGRILDTVRPDLVHFHCVQRLSASVVDAARDRRLPYLITAHDGWWISPHQFLLDPETDAIVTYDHARLPKPGDDPRAVDLRRPLLGADHVLAVSESFAEVYRLAGARRCIALPNGVPDLPVAPRVPSASGRVRLAHIGGMARHKGFHLVRNALSSGQFANLELLVIDHAMGDGMERHETWGATPVTFRPKVAQENVAGLYAGIDVMLAPSVWPESYGLVSREALRAGCWVVTSDRGAIGADVVDGVNGFVVSVENGFEDLIRVLEKLDADPAPWLIAPPKTPTLRTATEQAADLAEIYLRFCDGAR